MDRNEVDTILIVDDKYENIDALVSFLKKAGYRLLVAQSGEEVFRRIEMLIPDLILLDVLMPEIDGFEVCRKLKADEKYKGIPVIFMTALADMENKITGLELGAADYIAKPFQQQEVLARIKTQLNIGRLQKVLKYTNETLEHRVKERTDELTRVNEKLMLEISNRSQIEEELKASLSNMQKINAALEKSEDRFRMLVESITDYIYTVRIENGNAISTTHGPGCVTVTGYTSEEYEYDPYLWYKMIYDEDREIVSVQVEKLLRGETALPIEHRILHKDGSVRWVRNTPVLRLNDKMEPVAYDGLVSDITQRKNHEIVLSEANTRLNMTLMELKSTQKQVLQQERLRSLGQMASGIAHDINNSLSPILGYADLLIEEESFSEETKKFLNKIKMSSIDIRTIIERMREFYKPKSELENIDVISLNKIIIDSIELTKHRWKDIPEEHGKVININTIFDENLPAIFGSESEIREALINIILNSIDAIPDGGSIKFRTFLDNNKACIEIYDNGTGMDEDTLQRCMDPFFSTKGEKGTGLGLSMVFGIIQRHSGQINVDSKKNEGTTVIISFPPVNPQEISTISPLSLENSKNLKVLCIDDNHDVLDLLELVLSRMGCTVEKADSGKTGLNKFLASSGDEKFNLIITDLGMPYMDGYSVAKSIKNSEPDIPIILMTGWGAFIDHDTMREIDYILKKPITIDELRKALVKVFAESD